MGGTERGKGWQRESQSADARWCGVAQRCTVVQHRCALHTWLLLGQWFIWLQRSRRQQSPTVLGSPPKSLHPLQVALALKALQRYRLGTDMSLFATDQFATDPNAAYPGYPTGSGIESTETYQSPPFTETSDANPKGYQVPAY